MPKRNNFGTDAVLKKIYPLVEKALSTRKAQWMRAISQFMQDRSSSLFDIAPCDRIYYTEKDKDALFSALNISPAEVVSHLKDTYYWSIDPFKPMQAKDEVTIVCLCVIRYFWLKKDAKAQELAMIYMSFSGKFYPSIHFGFFKTVAPSKYRHVMEYVVNHKLTNKFDLKAQGSVVGAVKSIIITWAKAYTKQLQHFDDEDICYVIQQAHNRIKSFVKNIARLYYEAYENREFITYDKDSLPEEGDSALFHLTTNDSFRLQQYVEKTMEKINTSQVDYSVCADCSDANVKTEEVKSIIEAILDNTDNLKMLKEYITLSIATFLAESPIKEVNSIRYLNFCVKAKPNTKNPALLRMKEIIESFLDENSVGYRKRKHRDATKQSYHYAFAAYFGIMVIRANR